MHGYFLSLKLYETARVIANPFAYDEYREKMIRAKMEKMAESRIRTKKDVGVKVNKALAEKLLRDEEKSRKRARHKEKRGDGIDVNVEIGEDEAKESRPKLLEDPRFSRIFEDPSFAIDENSREFAMLNPSAAFQKHYSADRITAGSDSAEETGGSTSSGHVSNSESEHTDSEGLEDTSESSAEGI